MNKKFFSALLMGSLLLGGTVVSCTDYDDDIKNLQEQINTLASKSDVEAKVSQLQSAISAAQTAADAAKSEAQAAKTEAQAAKAAAGTNAEAIKAADAAIKAADEKIKAADEKIQALEAADKALQEALEAVKGEVADQLAEMSKATQEALEDALKQAKELVGEVADYVTDVDLVLSQSYGANIPVLEFVTIVEKENVFGKDVVSNPMTFTKNAQVQRPAAPISVRVSPANAVLTPENVSLVNSQGGNLDELLNLSVSKSNKLLTKATASTVWDVTATLKNYDKKVFEAAQKTKAGDILYAVQVNNTLENAADRYVTSSYDVTIKTGAYKPVEKLNFYVNETNVSFINNRRTNASVSLKQSGTTVAPEYVWKGAPAVAIAKDKSNVTEREVRNETEIIPSTKYVVSYYENTGNALHPVWVVRTREFMTERDALAFRILNLANYIGTETVDVETVVEHKVDELVDNRSKEKVYPLVQGEDLVITIDQFNEGLAKAKATDVKAMYVVLDAANAVESAPSELNAWESYSYTGLNQIFEAKDGKLAATIKIDSEKAIEDIIGFRVFAVNWDGTLVDPDGRAFYVKIGKEAEVYGDLDLVKVPVNATDKTAKQEKVTFAKQAKAAKVEFVTDENSEKVKLSATFNGTAIEAVDFKNEAGLKEKTFTITPDQALTVVKDGKKYTGTIKVYDADDFVLYEIPVSYTKNVPTTTPEGFTVKTAQVVDSVYNCYLLPSSAASKSAETGSMKMDQIFNFPTTAGIYMEKFTICFANTELDEKGEKFTEAQNVPGTGAVVVDKSLIDNTTEHATSASYNYGLISSEAKDKDGKIIDYVVETGVSFKTVYDCIYKPTVYTFAWATREQLGDEYTKKDDKGNYVKAMPYSTELTYGTTATLKPAMYIYGKTPIDGAYCGLIDPTLIGSSYNALALKASSAKLITKANGQVNEYFSVTMEGTTVKFEVEPKASNPTADVPTTLQLTYVDAYGHDVLVEVDVTVKKR